jgi:hypothetical protein
MSVLTDLRNRGVRDVLFLVCDGLKGLPEIVANVWPETIVQTCLVHLFRNTYRQASRRDWDALKKHVTPIYTAVNAAPARTAFDELAEAWGKRYPAIVGLWDNAWAGSPGTLPCRSPLRTGRAGRPGIRLKQALVARCSADVLRCVGRRAARRSVHGRVVSRADRRSCRAAR